MLGLVPFVGAELSPAFGFSHWRNLLLDNAPPAQRPDLQALLDDDDCEGAAERLLQTLAPDAFQNMVAGAACDRAFDPKSLRRGTMALLPLLGAGPVITTNFGRLLEAAFASNDRPFESVISGPRVEVLRLVQQEAAGVTSAGSPRCMNRIQRTGWTAGSTGSAATIACCDTDHDQGPFVRAGDDAAMLHRIIKVVPRYQGRSKVCNRGRRLGGAPLGEPDPVQRVLAALEQALETSRGHASQESAGIAFQTQRRLLPDTDIVVGAAGG